MLRQMSLRAIVALGLLVAATGAERFAYFAVRAFIAIDMSRSERMSAAAIGTTFTIVSIGIVVAMFAGALLILALGVRRTVAFGPLVAALGLSVAALGGPVLVAWSVGSIGAGVFRVCPFALAAEILGAETTDPDAWKLQSHARSFMRFAAFAATSHVAMNVCAFMAAPLAGALYDRGGCALAFGCAAAAAFVAAICSVSAAQLGMTGRAAPGVRSPVGDPYRAPAQAPAPRDAPASMKPLAGAAVLGCVAGAFAVGQAMIAGGFTDLAVKDVARLYAIGSGASVILSALVTAIVLIAALAGSSRGPLPLFGGGLAIAGFGFLVRAFAGPYFSAAAAAAGLAAFGEAVLPIGTAYAALALRGRASGLVLSGWFAVGSIATMLGSPLAFTGVRTSLLVLVGLGCVAAGIAMAALGRTLHRAWFAPPPA